MMPPSRQAGRCAAEAPVNLLRHKDLVGGYSPSSRVLVPGQYLGAIALADALDQGPPLDKLLGRGCWRLDRRGRRLAHAASVSAIHPVLSNSAQLRRRRGPRRLSRREKAFCVSRCSSYSCD
jgi:hypothetical protein